MDEVTTVVATRNRWTDLRTSLPRHRGDVVLVDNASTDSTPELVEAAFPGVRVVRLPANLGAVARNVGVLAAGTPLVAFADDDSWWAPGALERAAQLFEAHPRLGLVAAKVLVGDEETMDPTCALMADSPLGTAHDLPGPSVLGFIACGAVVRRSAFLEAGGFDDLIFFAGEEERLALDLTEAGWAVSYVDEVVAHHFPSADRDADSVRARRVQQLRNELLTAVLRRRWRRVVRLVARSVAEGPTGRAAVRRALLVAPRAVRARRPVSVRVERWAELVDAASGSPADGGRWSAGQRMVALVTGRG